MGLTWYLSRSDFRTNKKEALRIANELRKKGRFRFIRVLRRPLSKKEILQTAPKFRKMSIRDSYWIKVMR